MNRKAVLSITLLVVLTWVVFPAAADRDNNGRDRDKRKRTETSKKIDLQAWKKTRVVQRDRQYYEKRGYRYDSRHSHNHYYPPLGLSIRLLSNPYRRLPYRGVDYYLDVGGAWYRRSGVSFSVVMPPLGMVTPVLPPDYTTVWVGTVPYYYAGGVYYVWRSSLPGYVVVSEPDDNKIDVKPAVSEELFVYPSAGQDEQQQASDRYECYRWAADQSGFDPTLPAGGVAVDQHGVKRADYQRAMKACLDGRGYSVR